MQIEFEKWHGCGNDFIVFWAAATQKDMLDRSFAKLAPQICDRSGKGIGADGIIGIFPTVPTATTAEAPYLLSIINSDGSFASTCGNGLRCAAQSVARKYTQTDMPHSAKSDGNGLRKEELSGVSFILKDGQTADCMFLPGQGKNGRFVTVNMGQPTLNTNNFWHAGFIKEMTGKLEKLLPAELMSNHKRLFTVSFANNHLVLFTDKPNRDLMLKLGPELQKLESLDGINLHVAAAIEPSSAQLNEAKHMLSHDMEDLFETYTWERGAGPTQACGSGACAVAISALASGEAFGSSWIAVKMPGGILYCKHDSESNDVTLTGPAEFVFKGVIEI